MRYVFIRSRADISAANATMLQVFAANVDRPLRIVDFGVYLAGVSATAEPIHFQLLIQSTAGTGGGANTPAKLSRSDGENPEATGLDDSTAWSAEPTAGDVLHDWMVHPQWFFERPMPIYEIAGNERVAIRTATVPGALVKAIAYIVVED